MKILNHKIANSLFIYGIILVLITLFSGWRIYTSIHALASSVPPALIVIVFGILTLLILINHLLPKTPIVKFISRVSNVWMSFLFVSLFAALFESITYLVFVKLLKLIPHDIYYIFAVLWYFILLIAVVYGLIHGRRIKVRVFNCQISKPKSPEGKFRIIHLSDLHMNSLNDINVINDIVAKTNNLDGDLVCITGDFFTESMDDVYDISQLKEAFRSIKSKHGVYACLGNHDSGPDLNKMLEFLEQSNIKLLKDEYIEIGGIILAGRTDLTPGGKKNKNRPSVKACLSGTDREKIIVVMDHQPAKINACAEEKVDILLSGHTHAGEFFPFQYFVKLVFPHYYGCQKTVDTYTIVSPGSNASIPHVRIGTRSEIFEVIIHNTKS